MTDTQPPARRSTNDTSDDPSSVLRPLSAIGTPTVYYRTRPSRRSTTQQGGLPIPHIRPRPRRPQAIHIISYPSGYIPSDLRTPKAAKSKSSSRRKQQREQQARLEKRSSWSSSGPEPARSVLDKVFGPLKLHFTQADPSAVQPPDYDTAIRPETQLSQRPLLSSSPQAPPPSTDVDVMVDTRRSQMLSASLSPSSMSGSTTAGRSLKSVMSSVTEVPRPVASGSGLTCSIILAEPNVFLTGFEHDGHTRHESANSTALLRGKLQLNVSKNTKIKAVTLKLSGRARTEWPEGIPPLKTEQFEEESLRTQVLTFFHAQHETWETDYGNQCTFTLRGSGEASSRSNSSLTIPGILPSSNSSNSIHQRTRSGSTFTARDYKKLSLANGQSRSFGKGDSQSSASAPPKGYKVFYPGTYEYAFELPIDHHQLETTKLQFGSVKWELETVVERAGAFKPNLHGTKEVSVVRVPDQLSLEMTEPISISRQWEDQLHYDIMISGKSFPLGSKIPIAFKLTPLAKVQVHKLKVFVTESVEYWTNDRRVTRKDPGRKVLLLEKVAGKPLDKQYEKSEVRVLSGGELAPEQRQEARRIAERRRSVEASRAHAPVQPLPEPTENLLGDLDLGLESYWAATEIEMNVQLPTCEQMSKEKGIRLHPDCSWKNVNVFHWIKIVMRISRLDPEDPTGKKRRHFEISIDSPFTVLNCRATQANTALPEYTGAEMPMYRQQAKCGCPDAEVLATNPSPASSTGTIPGVDSSSTLPGFDSSVIAPPPAAHLQQHPGASTQPLHRPSANPTAPAGHRPIHLLRYPSFNPPAFDEDEAPPPLATPPPQYDIVVGTPSVDGLADYFSRLADYDDGDTDSDEEQASRLMDRHGRLSIANPRTPGGRAVASRSMDLPRPSATQA